MMVLQDRIRVNRNRGLNVCLIGTTYGLGFSVGARGRRVGRIFNYIDCSKTFGFSIFNMVYPKQMGVKC